MINTLKIINGDTIKSVTLDFLVYLYKICTGQNNDLPDNTNLYVLTNESNIVGHVSVSAVYDHVYNYLINKFQDFHITYNKQIIYFRDKVIEQLLCAQYGSDGTLTPAQAQSVSSLMSFNGNTNITSFDELSYFTNVHNIGGNNVRLFSGCTNLETIDLINITGRVYPYSFLNCSKCNFKNVVNITEINEYAFDNCKELTFVDLSNLKESQSTIGNYTFRNCTSLETVILGPYIYKLSNGVFQNCNSLTNINLSNITEILGGAFVGCNNLSDDLDLSNIESCDSIINIKNINMPKCKTLGTSAFSVESNESNGLRIETITILNAEDLSKGWLFCRLKNLKEIHVNVKQGYNGKLGNYFVSRCTNLEVFDIGDNITELGSNIFSANKIKNLNLNKVQIVGSRSFSEISSIVTLTANYLTTIGDNAFNRCGSLIRINSDEDYTFNLTGVTSIANNAFDHTYPKKVILDSNLKVLNNNTFYQSNTLESINLDNIESIGLEALRDCYKIETLTFNKLKSLHTYALAYLNWEWIKITNEEQMVTIGDETTPAANDAFKRGGTITMRSHRIYVPDSLYNDYLNDASWTTALSTGKATLKKLSEFTSDYGS